MSNFWWLQPDWTEALCTNCGARIWPEGDPDWGLCWLCMQQKTEQEMAVESERARGDG